MPKRGETECKNSFFLIVNMIDRINNLKKNTFITKGHPKRDSNRFSFRADNEITHHLQKKIYDKSKFIIRALRFYIILITDPKKIMIELKKREPELWKKVNRTRFI